MLRIGRVQALEREFAEQGNSVAHCSACRSSPSFCLHSLPLSTPLDHLSIRLFFPFTAVTMASSGGEGVLSDSDVASAAHAAAAAAAAAAADDDVNKRSLLDVIVDEYNLQKHARTSRMMSQHTTRAQQAEQSAERHSFVGSLALSFSCPLASPV